jgi:hypothetical protein
VEATAEEAIAMSVAAFPVRVDATMDGELSRWLWLVKRLLVIPHLVVLAFLWIAFAITGGAVALIAVPIARASRPDGPHSEGDRS